MSVLIRDLPNSYYKSVEKNDKKRGKRTYLCPKCGEEIEPIDTSINKKLRQLLKDSTPLR